MDKERFQSFKVSRFQGFKVSEFQGLEVEKIRARGLSTGRL
jgi:hypothetical protein